MVKPLTGSARPPVMAKIDYKKSLPEVYGARRAPAEVRVPGGTFLAVDGVGEPGDAAFQEAMHQLFTLAYTTRFTMKKAGGVDFTVPALECVYLDNPCEKGRREWHWRVMVRVPPCVKAPTLREVRKAIAAKKGPATDAVKRITWAEGKALQLLHVGPYDQVGTAYQRLADETAARGLQVVGPAHEIYLNDPRRVAPERLKTIVRMAVKKGR
ncbi:MAG TPA: GyrI-like domain-containing protein [Vicinamibacterales bacterium]|nr:GyrI-like domain-containing protein [Acidobacteriota bacterium]HOC16818.1 GyrI-like domain-containing protein [Vicinamibacterales bacterium]